MFNSQIYLIYTKDTKRVIMAQGEARNFEMKRKWENINLAKQLHMKDDKEWEEYHNLERPIPTSTGADN